MSPFASILMSFLLAAGLLGIAPVVNAASTDRPFVKPGEGVRNNAIELKRRARGRRVLLPIGPSYVYYDYPYYYSRGYYPTHIGGYIYYPYYYRSHDPRHGGSPRRQRAH